MEDYYVIDHIIRLCHEKNWTYYRLAKESNIPYSSLCAMLNHRHIPTINNLIKICGGFNISLSEFFWGIEMNTCINQKPSLAYLWNKLDVKSKELMLNHIYDMVLCQDNGHIKPLFFSKISKMHKLVAFIPRFA